MAKRFRDRLRAYWWLWGLIVVAAVILNFDRDVAGDKSGHPAGDLLVAVAVVLIVLMVWDFVTRKSRST